MEVSGEVADLMVKEGLEAAKIAAELSVSENTVRSTLRRTRDKLHTYLEKEGLL